MRTAKYRLARAAALVLILVVPSAPADKIYWGTWDFDTPSTIKRANLDGSGIENLIVGETGQPFDVAVDSGGKKLYWADFSRKQIRRANLDGSEIEDLIDTVGAFGPRRVALHLPSGKVYWTTSGEIHRADLDGSNIEDIITQEPLEVGAIALHTALGKVYWHDGLNGRIRRANQDGTLVEDVIPNGIGDVNGLAIDANGGKMYWSVESPGRIQRADLDGSNIEDIVTTVDPAPQAIAVDPLMGKVYWGNSVSGTLRRADLNGSNVEIVVAEPANRQGLDLDLLNGKVYWADPTSQMVQRANIDGTNIEDIVTSGLVKPDGIAVDRPAGKLYWVSSATRKLRRANLDGSQVENVLNNVFGLWSIALDLDASKAYMAGGTRVQRVNFDGTGLESLIENEAALYVDIALDARSDKMYLVDFAVEKIQRANLDGTDMEDVITDGIGQVTTIAIDVDAGNIYWSDYGTGDFVRYVRRANLDGSNVENLVENFLASSIVLDVNQGKMYPSAGAIYSASLDGTNLMQIVPDDNSFLGGLALDIACTPGIGAHPVSTNVCSESAATFSAAGTGVLVMSYQWRKDGVDIPGATQSTYTIDPVTPDDAGSYDVVVSNLCGSATSNAATLIVLTTACDDLNSCTRDDTCSAGICAGMPHCQLHGDVFPFDGGDPDGNPVGNCVVDIDDMLTVLASFSATDHCAGFPNGVNTFDPNGCGTPCVAGTVDIDDILSGLAAFSGTFGCPHPCPP